MAIAPIITAAAAVIGTGVSFYGQMKQQEAQRKQERIRRRQMELEAARRRRQIIREAALKRAESAATGYAQGAGTSSAMAGAIGGISQQAGSNILATNQGQALGQQMFAANAQEASGGMISNIGQGLGSLGKGVADLGTALDNRGFFS